MKLTPDEEKKLTEAAVSLRCAAGFALFEKHLKRVLDETKDKLVLNQTAQVPNLQGRAQQLLEVIELLNRK